MHYPKILAAVRNAKWAIHEPAFEAILRVLGSRLAGERHIDAPASFDAGLPIALPPGRLAYAPAARLPGGKRAEVISTGGSLMGTATAVVPFHGICAKRISSMEADCGGVSLETLQRDLVAALANPRVARVVLHLDSPGGTVTGIPELAGRIREWSKEKPIYAFADNLCASAAYWLSTGCAGFFATPTADIGSIGVYMLAVDDSEAWAKEGYKAHLIRAGSRKAEGCRGIPIAPETLALWQQEVDDLYTMFTGAVTAARPAITSETMQGQCFMGEAALRAGLVDDIVTDLDDLLEQLG